MNTMSMDDYEKLIDKIISGNFSAEDVTNFVKNTPVMPILAKMGINKNIAQVEVIVTDPNGTPIPDAEVILAGKTSTTDPTGKAVFSFTSDVPPGVILIKKGTALSRVPFDGLKEGQKATVAAILCNGAESPVAVGQSLKDVMNTYYQWKMIQNIEHGVFRPELEGMPQVGVLRRKSDYEYQVYIPVPVNINVPAINFKPVVGNEEITSPVPPPAPKPPTIQQPKTYSASVSVVPGTNANPSWQFKIVLSGITNPAIVKEVSGTYGKYTFSGLYPGIYQITVMGPNGVATKTFEISNSNVSESVSVIGQAKISPPAPPHVVPSPAPTPSPTPSPITPTPGPGSGQPVKPAPPRVGTVTVSVIPDLSSGPFTPGYTPNVVVYLDSTEKKGSFGTYVFSNVLEGLHHVAVVVDGKSAYVGDVMVRRGQNEVINVKIKAAQNLPPKPHPPTPPPKPPAPPPKNTPSPAPKKNPNPPSVNPPSFSPSPTPVPTPIIKPSPAPGTIVVDVRELTLPSNIHGAGALSLALSNPSVDVYVDGVHKSGGIGKYTFSNLSPGDHNIKVYINGKMVYNQTVHVSAGETKSVQVTYHPPPPKSTIVVEVKESQSSSSSSSGSGESGTPSHTTPPPSPPHINPTPISPPSHNVSSPTSHPSPPVNKTPPSVSPPKTPVSHPSTHTSPPHNTPPPYHVPPPGGGGFGPGPVGGFHPIRRGPTLAFAMVEEGVTVEVDGVARHGSFGKYTFNNIPPGTHTVKVMYNGQVIKNTTVNVQPGKTSQVIAVVIKKNPTIINPSPVPIRPKPVPIGPRGGIRPI